MLSHCGFVFLKVNCCIFMYFYAILIYSFVNCPFKFLSIFNYVFSYCWDLRIVYIFWNSSPLLNFLFSNMFSQSIACLFILLVVCLTEQKLLIVMVFCFPFTDMLLMSCLKALPSTRFSPIFPYKCFIVLYLIFMSVIQFEYIFI